MCCCHMLCRLHNHLLMSFYQDENLYEEEDTKGQQLVSQQMVIQHELSQSKEEETVTKSSTALEKLERDVKPKQSTVSKISSVECVSATCCVGFITIC